MGAKRKAKDLGKNDEHEHGNGKGGAHGTSESEGLFKDDK
jgi:hypothetical protein